MTRRLPRGRGRTPVPGPGEVYACRLAAVADRVECSETELQGIETVLHDAVIAGVGVGRRSGVWWTRYHGREAQRFIEALLVTAPDSVPDQAGDDLIRSNAASLNDRQQILEALTDNPRGGLLVAWCLAKEGYA